MDALTHCRATLLPICELWTDADPALRRALDCMSADSASRQEGHIRLRALRAWGADESSPRRGVYRHVV